MNAPKYAPHKIRRKASLFILMAIFLLLPWFEARAVINVNVSGPGGRASQVLPDNGGAFDVSIPLNRNAVNNIRVTATDNYGNQAEKGLAITQRL